MLGLAETRVGRLSFAKPSTKVLDLANSRAEGAWAWFLHNQAPVCSILQTQVRRGLGLAETRAERLGFAKPSTMVLDLAKLRAEGTWAGRSKGGKAWFSQNRAPVCSI